VRFQVLHFTVFPIRDPSRKNVQLAEVSDRRNAAEVESGSARAPLDAGWKVGKQVGSRLRQFGRWAELRSSRKGYHFTAL
jgi:hypothetical protein